MVLWLLGLPFAFVVTLGWWSIIVCTVVGYGKQVPIDLATLKIQLNLHLPHAAQKADLYHGSMTCIDLSLAELLGFETIGVEIENPFGRDYNDLPLDMVSFFVCNLQSLAQRDLPTACCLITLQLDEKPSKLKMKTQPKRIS